MAVFFSFYIAFATLVMLNLVTGIFVESAQTNIREDKDHEIVNQVKELFLSSDENHSGFITWPEFENQLENPKMAVFFKAVDLDMTEARSLFKLLDIHGTGEINSEEFVNGC